MKSIIIVAFVILGCVAFNEALECYSHDVCSANCPQLSNTVKTCTGDDNKCFKAAFPGGVKRGCGKERCNVQVDASSIMANVCCDKNLCNSAMTPKVTFSTLLMIIGAFILARM